MSMLLQLIHPDCFRLCFRLGHNVSIQVCDFITAMTFSLLTLTLFYEGFCRHAASFVILDCWASGFLLLKYAAIYVLTCRSKSERIESGITYHTAPRKDYDYESELLLVGCFLSKSKL